MRKFLQWVGGLVAVLAIFVALHYAFNMLSDYQRQLVAVPPVNLQPPYLHFGDQIATTAMHPGQYFFVHVNNQRTKNCIASVRYRILSEHMHDEADHITIWFSYDGTIGFTLAGSFEADTFLRVPAFLPDGDYILDRYGTYTCEGIRIDQSHIGKLPFRITRPVMHDDEVIAPRDARP